MVVKAGSSLDSFVGLVSTAILSSSTASGEPSGSGWDGLESSSSMEGHWLDCGCSNLLSLSLSALIALCL